MQAVLDTHAGSLGRFSVYWLLRGFSTDCNEIGHGSICTRESQGGNPIGKALVVQKH